MYLNIKSFISFLKYWFRK